MKAGRMDQRVELMEPVRTKDGYGDERTEYVARATAWAEQVRHTGSRSEEVAEHFADHRTEWNIRTAHSVGENWRLRHVGGFTYTVTAIVENRKRGYRTLYCERLNE